MDKKKAAKKVVKKAKEYAPTAARAVSALANPVGAGVGLARQYFGSAEPRSRDPRDIEQGIQNPGEGITDPKTGRKVPTLQAITQKVPTYRKGKWSLVNDSPLPESLPSPGLGGSALAATPPPPPPPQGGVTNVPMNVPPTQAPQQPFVGNAGVGRQSLRDAIGPDVADINDVYGVPETDREAMFADFMDSDQGRSLGTSIAQGVTPELQSQASESYGDYVRNATHGQWKTVTTEEPHEVDAAMVANPKGLKALTRATKPVVIHNAHDLGFMSDKVVVVPGAAKAPKEALDTHEPPVVSQRGFIELMKYLKG